VLKPEIEKMRIRVRKVSPSQMRRIDADSAQLTQLFLNLLLNALQAMREGGELSITAGEKAGDGDTEAASVVVEITDTGHGMSQQVLEHLFMPFYTNRENGTGLGLAIAHRIVEEHGGTIDVASKEGKGTTFTISFKALQPN
jgi:two-component system sensor histidine kinase HydH